MNIFLSHQALKSSLVGPRWTAVPDEYLLGLYESTAMWRVAVLKPSSRLGNLVTDFMISDESGNRFFPTPVTDYWQD